MTAPPLEAREPRGPPDATRHRRLEAELLEVGRELARVHSELESQRELVARERAEREELLAVVSHELRTPVTVISGYSRLLLSEEVGPLTPEQRKFLEESGKSCRRLDAFIEKLLVASEAARGAEVLEVGRAPLAPVLHGTAELFHPLLEENDLRLSLDLASDASEARFDRVRLEQVLTNLVGNAVKFTPAGGQIEIATRALDAPANRWVRRWVEIRVSDDGPGIPPGDRARVLEPYVQLGGRSGGGLGLGLAICKRLVEAHGGQIRLEERLGGGCSVRFTLPVDAPQSEEEVAS
jgi:signal transduction histidine kinase